MKMVKIEDAKGFEDIWFRNCVCCGKGIDDIVGEDETFHKIQFTKTKSIVVICEGCLKNFVKEMNKYSEIK